MDYDEIVKVAKQYADRETDVEVNDNIDAFLRIVESRVNMQLTVREMYCRGTIVTTQGKVDYGLPSDFESLRDVRYSSNNTHGTITLEYVNPLQSNEASQRTSTSSMYYTILAEQLRIVPAPGDGVLEIVYARKVPALTTGTSNWLSISYPQIYIFGTLVEINAFAKDATATEIWEGRFQKAMTALEDNDAVSRWSGTPLRIRRA
jgi:hypothetical protein